MGSAKPSVKLDQQVADIMRAAIETTLHNMFNITAQCGIPVVGKEPFAEEPCVASMLDMIETGEVLNIFIITFSLGAAKRVLTACDFPRTDDPAIARDAVNEVANVVYGEVKKKLNQLGHNFILELPRTVHLTPQFFQEYRNSERLVLPFSADGHVCHAAIMTKN